MGRPRCCNIRAASCFETRCFATLLSMRPGQTTDVESIGLSANFNNERTKLQQRTNSVIRISIVPFLLRGTDGMPCSIEGVF